MKLRAVEPTQPDPTRPRRLAKEAIARYRQRRMVTEDQDKNDAVCVYERLGDEVLIDRRDLWRKDRK